MKNKIFNLFKEKKIKLDLDKIYEENKHYFELLLVKDFVGYIPKDVNEPALKMFKEYGEIMEQWTLWHSWYVNRRAMNDPIKISFYNGMMVYLKVLNTMARINKKNYQPEKKQVEEEIVATSFLDSALEDLKEFQNGIKDYKRNKDSSTENTEI